MSGDRVFSRETLVRAEAQALDVKHICYLPTVRHSMEQSGAWEPNELESHLEMRINMGTVTDNAAETTCQLCLEWIHA